VFLRKRSRPELVAVLVKSEREGALLRLRYRL
jgi:hypothetical protein